MAIGDVHVAALASKVVRQEKGEAPSEEGNCYRCGDTVRRRPASDEVVRGQRGSAIRLAKIRLVGALTGFHAISFGLPISPRK